MCFVFCLNDDTQQDNTPAGAKKSYCAKVAAWLVLKGVFRSSFLRVGHTHEDVDRYFAIIWFLLLSLGSWQLPTDIVSFLQQKLAVYFTDRGEETEVYVLDVVVNFKDWVAKLAVKAEGAFANRGDAFAPHYFLFKRRQGVTNKCAFYVCNYSMLNC